MPGGFPVLGDICNGMQIAVNPASSSRPVNMTYPGSTNTKAAYTQIIASTASDACFALVQLHCGSGSGDVSALVDIAVGAAASEVVVCSNLASVLPASGGAAFVAYAFPLNIPAGSRVSARCQVDNVSGSFQTVGISIVLFDGGFTETESCGGVDMLGVSTSTSLATTLTGGAGATTFGSYSQLIASTARDYSAIMPFAVGTANDDFLIDLAIGSAGSENVIVPNMATTASSLYGAGISGYYLPINIPAGSRLAARCSPQFGGSTTIAFAVAGVYR